MISAKFLESQLEGRGWTVDGKFLYVESWFSRRFLRARQALGMTPNELAGVLRWKTSSLIDVEQGRYGYAGRRESIEKAVNFFCEKGVWK